MILLVMFVEMSTNVSRILWIFLSEYNRFDTGIRCSLPDSFYKHKWIESRSSFLKYCFVFTNCEINNHQPYDLYIYIFSRFPVAQGGGFAIVSAVLPEIDVHACYCKNPTRSETNVHNLLILFTNYVHVM